MTRASGGAAPARPRRVPRRVDALALALILGGIALYAHAQRGMTRFAAGTMRHASASGPAGGSNLAEWGTLDRLSRLGLALAASGVVLSIAALAWVKLRRQPVLPNEQADDS